MTPTLGRAAVSVLTFTAFIWGCDRASPTVESTPVCPGADRSNVEKRLEGTNGELSGFEIGVGNLLVRVREDRKPAAKELSAHLFIHDPASMTDRRETVFVGGVYALGHDRYCVLEINEGTDTKPGWVTMAKMP